MLDKNHSTINDTVDINDTQKNNNLIYYFVPIYAILFVIGTFGNGLVIISIFRSTRLRTVTNTYLLNIAIADFLLLLSAPFLIVNILADGWIFGNVLCKMYFNFIYVNQYVSSLLLAALSFDRYLAVCHPIRAIEFRTRTKCALIITGCWFISVFLLCPTWLFAVVTSNKHVEWHGYKVQKCVIDFPANKTRIPPEIMFTYYAFLLGFLFPVSMITTFYVLVLVRLHRIRQKHKSEVKQRAHRKVTRIVLAVITAYFICWVPYWFWQIFITIEPLIYSLHDDLPILKKNLNIRFLREFTHLTTIIGFVNNCLNPVLYVFLSESFREEYLFVLKCFNPSNALLEHIHNNENVLRNDSERRLTRQQLIDCATYRSATKKNVKHSVAIDDFPASYRAHSSHDRTGYDQTRGSYSSSSVQINDRLAYIGEQTSLYAKTSNDYRKKDVQQRPRRVSIKSSPKMIDDGGVYCGE